VIEEVVKSIQSSRKPNKYKQTIASLKVGARNRREGWSGKKIEGGMTAYLETFDS